MTPEELEDWKMVQNKMNNEGFHYCFESYSRFEEIKDGKFHELRLNYLNSAKLLEDYINEKCDNDYDFDD